MSHKFLDEEDRIWEIGYSKEWGGFYALRHRPPLEAKFCRSPYDVTIGHQNGFSRPYLEYRLGQYGIVLPWELVMQLEQDKEVALRPRSQWLRRLWDKVRRK